jgi:RimJ/RimL family protein N-acetyltransferase
MSAEFLLVTPRLYLRKALIGDASALEGVFCDPDVMRYGDGVKSSEWIREWLADDVARLYATHGYGPYAVVERATDRVIGYCGLSYFPDIAGQPEVEIGYRLVRVGWGQGYATEAALAVRDYAFDVLALMRVVALIDPSNSASVRVAKKIGMRYERDVMLPGYDHPDHLYVVHSHDVARTR